MTFTVWLLYYIDLSTVLTARVLKDESKPNQTESIEPFP